MSVTDQIINGVYDFMAPEWEEYSDVAKDFISRLLQIEPGNRMTIQETRLHPFLNMVSSVQQRSLIDARSILARLFLYNSE